MPLFEINALPGNNTSFPSQSLPPAARDQCTFGIYVFLRQQCLSQPPPLSAVEPLSELLYAIGTDQRLFAIGRSRR